MSWLGGVVLGALVIAVLAFFAFCVAVIYGRW